MAGKKDKWWGDEREVAELIWCAAHLHRILAPPSSKDVERQEDLLPPDGETTAGSSLEGGTKTPSPAAEETEQRTHIATYPKKSEHTDSLENRESPSSARASPVRVPDPFPLPKPGSISKALLPLAKRVPGILVNELDVDATVEQTAEANGLPLPVFRPPLERWFEVHLLIDRSPSMEFWGDLAEGVATLFRWQGFFRDVRVWQFETGESEPQLFSGAERIEREIRSLIAPGRNQLFVAFTDTLGKAWHSGKAFAALAVLGDEHPVAIAHVFPQTLWRRTALHQAIQRPLVAPQSGCANSMLKVGARLHTTARLYRFPIFNLSPNHFTTWANFLAGSGGNSIQGVLIRQDVPAAAKVDSSKQMEDKHEPVEETPEYLLRGFLTDASSEARELAGVLAAVPMIPPVMRLAQQQFLPDSKHWHLAEVFFSGLLQRSPLGPAEATVPETWYEFRAGIRELLLENSPVQRTAEIWREIGDFIQHHYGSPRDFQALIPNPSGSIQDTAADRELYFAEVEAAVLMTWGGEYASRAQELRKKVAARKREKERSSQLSLWEKVVQVATIVIEETETIPETIPLQRFESETVFVDQRGKIIRREPCVASYFEQELGEGVEPLKMISIPAGEFWMGAPKEEKDSNDYERPQHKVKVTAFYMSQTPITQAQWRAVANLPQEQRELTLNPSEFEGDNLPVERVSWYDAMEFCARLSRHTECNYRLPSEAEWEYACRAVTSHQSPVTSENLTLAEWNEKYYQPFHFGETITDKLANYGYQRGQTTPVGSFPPNAFGLYDMHGNVWEWCADPWHDNYQKAPLDGRVWDEEDNDNCYQNILENLDTLLKDSSTRVIRGGSWDLIADICRSAYRSYRLPAWRLNIYGFRVVRG